MPRSEEQGPSLWNVRAPMIMSTFTDAFDFRGRTVHPVTTYAMSGLGTTERDYAASCPGAVIGEGLAVRGEGPRGRCRHRLLDPARRAAPGLRHLARGSDGPATDGTGPRPPGQGP
ncbi:flavodoxin [Streptomyces sp. NPDC050273]|uniref:flavodoxin n=1 Tax=Streptomyces sp. NPDC050273 TaxID=3154933 RepID=UPI003434A2AC